MPGRFWKWRMQGAALELAQQVKRHCQMLGRPDVLFVTDMVNLPALLALSRPWLDGVPSIFYAHENQLTYPSPPGEKRDLTYGMINALSMVTADAIAFNSTYHLEAFFDELPRLLKHFPDFNHLELIPHLRAKSHTLAVGLDLLPLDEQQTAARCSPNTPLRILWNQRWEYDKNPTEFFNALYELDNAGLAFQLIVAGENFRQQPSEFSEAQQRLAKRIIHFGYAKDRESYARLLWEADLVISTAHHEFFGISILEAIYCGCFPLLPHRLSYPEFLPTSCHDTHLYHDYGSLIERLRWAVLHPHDVRSVTLREIAAAYDWRLIAPRYDTYMSSINTQLS